MKTKTILIVDDQPFIRHVLGVDLQKQGFNIVTAENGKIGLEVARKHLPDLILMDVMMPVMDGFETCRHIKEDDHLKHIPVIFLSANAQQSALIKAKQSGSDDYAVKSPDPTLLLETIRKHLKV